MLPVHFKAPRHAHFSQQRQWQEELLDEELRLQKEKFEELADMPARRLLEGQGELFVCSWMREDSAGNAVLAFSPARGLPRLREHFQLLLLPADLIVHRNWPSGLTYRDLLGRCLDLTEVSCIWHGSGPTARGYLESGFRGPSVAFASRVIPGSVLILGPKLPPVDYLRNLIQVVRHAPPDTAVGRLLDLPQGAGAAAGAWQPSPLPAEGNAGFLLAQSRLAQESVTLVQGPPGTGKTYLLAEICASLLQQNKRVLVTALTHRALLELAVKPQLTSWRKAGRIRKMTLATDELAEAPGLRDATELMAGEGSLLLATFHATSRGAVPGGQPLPFDKPGFDYVLVDEASQALLPMLALARSLGRHQFWVGDTAQLPPIIRQSVKGVRVPGAIHGLQTVSWHDCLPAFQLTRSHRLPPRAALFTGLFYANGLTSAAPRSVRLLPGGLSPLLAHILHPDGGPVLMPLKLPPGEESPQVLLQAVYQLVTDLFLTDEPLSVAVLTHHRATSRNLQRLLATRQLPAGCRLIVDTVARVQGLTCDVCLYVLPAVGYAFSLKAAAFNVATSRARRHTIILADEGINVTGGAAGPVAAFLNLLQHPAAAARQLNT